MERWLRYTSLWMYFAYAAALFEGYQSPLNQR